MGSIPAAALIISLFCLLLYLMSRCCDRKPRPAHSITSLKVTLSIVTVLCCAAIGLGKFKSSIKSKFFFFLFHSFTLIDTHKVFFLSYIRYCSLLPPSHVWAFHLSLSLILMSRLFPLFNFFFAFNWHRLIWKWWFTQRLAGIINGRQKSGQPRVECSQPNECTWAHAHTKDSTTNSGIARYFRWACLKSNGPIDTH